MGVRRPLNHTNTWKTERFSAGNWFINNTLKGKPKIDGHDFIKIKKANGKHGRRRNALMGFHKRFTSFAQKYYDF